MVGGSDYAVTFQACCCTTQLPEERGQADSDGTKAERVRRSAAGERRRRRGRTRDCAGAGAAGSDGAAVAAGQGEVGARQAGLVGGVDDDGAVPEETAWSGSGGEVEIQIAGQNDQSRSSGKSLRPRRDARDGV